MTVGQVSDAFGVTPDRIRQIKSTPMARLRVTSRSGRAGRIETSGHHGCTVGCILTEIKVLITVNMGYNGFHYE